MRIASGSELKRSSLPSVKLLQSTLQWFSLELQRSLLGGETGDTGSLTRNIEEALKNLEEFRKPDLHALGTLDDPGAQFQEPPGFCQVHIGKEKFVFCQSIGMPNCTLQVDGSWEKLSGRFGFGWSAKIDEGDFFDAGAGFGQATSALHMEAQACLEGLKWCTSMGFVKVLLYSG
uniref:RNase H type-1 domain-containing protein n=1 Tax=Chenopodium quinoa TaxID=63459 RepID=A0A803N0F7_CHEQI